MSHSRTVERSNPDRSCSSTRCQTAGMWYRRVACRRSAVPRSVGASGVVAKCTGHRVCHALTVIDHPDMWKSGNMHTVPPEWSLRFPWNERSQLARFESTTPFGRPVLPLVKKTTWVDASLRPSGLPASTASSRSAAANSSAWGTGSGSRPSKSAACDSSAISRCGFAYSSTSTASSAPRRALTGMNAAPRRARALKIGIASSDVSPHHATRSPTPMPSPASACGDLVGPRVERRRSRPRRRRASRPRWPDGVPARRNVADEHVADEREPYVDASPRVSVVPCGHDDDLPRRRRRPRRHRGPSVAVVGYGNQGRSWALNLRDSGLRRPGVRARRRVAASRRPPTASRRGDLAAASDADVVCVLVPDDVIPLARRSSARRTGSRSSRAATRSRSTASTRPATSGWSRRACSAPRCGAATRRASGSSPRSASTAT